jgi:hypothetical protein
MPCLGTCVYEVHKERGGTRELEQYLIPPELLPLPIADFRRSRTLFGTWIGQCAIRSYTHVVKVMEVQHFHTEDVSLHGGSHGWLHWINSTLEHNHFNTLEPSVFTSINNHCSPSRKIRTRAGYI